MGKNNVRFFFAENLKRIRLEKGVSYEALADCMGVSISAVRQYEKGLKLPAIDKIFEAANLLQVSVTALIGENDYSDTTPNVAKIIDDKIFEYRLQRIMDFLRNCKCYVTKPNKGSILLTVPARIAEKDKHGKVIKVKFGALDTEFADEVSLVMFVERAEAYAINSSMTLADALADIIQREDY